MFMNYSHQIGTLSKAMRDCKLVSIHLEEKGKEKICALGNL